MFIMQFFVWNALKHFFWLVGFVWTLGSKKGLLQVWILTTEQLIQGLTLHAGYKSYCKF